MLTYTALEELAVSDGLFEPFAQYDVRFTVLTRSFTGNGRLMRFPDGKGIFVNGGCDGLDFGRYRKGTVNLFE